MVLKGSIFICFVTTTVGISQLAHGALIGYPAVLLPQFYQPGSDLVSSKTIDSWITSSLAITLLVGSFMAPVIMDRFGRKAIHYAVCVFAAAGWVITCLARHVEVVLFARIIGGLSYGMMLPLRSILIGEYTSPKNRGAFLTTLSLTQGGGILFVHLIGSLLSWRSTAFICLFLPLTSFIMTILLPESPSWLVYRRRFDDSRKAFLSLRGDEEKQEIDDMINAKIDLDEENKNRKKDIFSNIRRPEFYKPIILMLHLYTLGNVSGPTINAAYSSTIIQLITNTEVNANIWMIILDIERIIVSIIAIYVINKVKRRPMVVTTTGLCIFSLLAQATYVFSKRFGFLNEDKLWIPGLLMMLQMFSISLGMMPLPTVIAGEVFPLQYRSIASTISLLSMSAGMFLVLKTFVILEESIGMDGVYVMYSSSLIYCLIIILILLPETMGRTLQDIENEFRGKVTYKQTEETKSLKGKVDEQEKSNTNKEDTN